jgi:putative aldouronate transport system permease protein
MRKQEAVASCFPLSLNEDTKFAMLYLSDSEGRAADMQIRLPTKRKKVEYALYLMLVPALVLVFIYSYIPLAGLVVAFKQYDLASGIMGSKWAGLANFKYLLTGYKDLPVILWNTVFIACMKIIARFFVPIIVAILLNEVARLRYKKMLQTMIYLPYFISWVIVAGIMIDVLNPTDGAINLLLKSLGLKPIYFLGQPALFPFIMVITDSWKDFGFGTIIYMAALTSIDPTLYEAAVIDGASRWQKIKHITMPGIEPIMVLVGTLSLGSVLNAGFDQIYNCYNPMVYSTGDILDTFIYRIGIQQAQYGIATALGLMRSVVSLVMVGGSYFLAYKVADYRIF